MSWKLGGDNLSLSQGFPNTFVGQVTNEVTKNLDKETKKIYTDINAFMASNGHSHTGNGSDGALIDVLNPTGALHQANPVSITSITGVLTLLETSNSFIASGTEAITSITGWTKGIAYIRWNTARTLTYNATSLILQNTVDRVTAVGDVGVYEATSVGVREIGYFPVALRVVYPVQVRQTVLSGAVDANGNANQLQIGTGLAVNELATTVPTVTTWANGFDSNGTVDYVQRLTSTVSSAWSGLTANSTLYLYKDRNSATGAVTYGFTTLPKIELPYAPSSPATNQYWFDITNMVGQYWSGSAWVAVQRVFIGECVTGSSTVTSVKPYAYQGRYDSQFFSITTSTDYIKNHNIGNVPLYAKLYGATDINGANMTEALEFSIPANDGVVSAATGASSALVGYTRTTINARSGLAPRILVPYSISANGYILATHYRIIASRGW